MKENTPKRKQNKAVKALKIVALTVGYALLALLTVHSMLCIFMDGYYPTFWNKRLFAVVTDSMEPEIPAGSMIVSSVPSSEEQIAIGSVITFEVKTGGEVTLFTHRVANIEQTEDGRTVYITKGDNAPKPDAYRTEYGDIVGVYTGEKCGVLGYIAGFIQSTEGAIALIIILLIAVLAFIVVRYVELLSTWRNIALAALEKSRGMLAGTENEEMGTIADVIGIVSKEPYDKLDLKRKDKKLGRFIRLGVLPKRPYSDDWEDGGDSAAEIAATELESGNISEVPVKRPPFALRAPDKKRGIANTFAVRLVLLDDRPKNFYCLLKNVLLSYEGVRSRLGKKCETFTAGRKTVARLSIRGKTVCLSLAEPPEDWDENMYAVGGRSSTPVLIKIKTPRRCKLACEQLRKVLSATAAEKPDYAPCDFYMSLDGIVAPRGGSFSPILR